MERIGLEDMLIQAFLAFLSDWWWLIAIFFTVVILNAIISRKGSRRSRSKSFSRNIGRRVGRATPREKLSSEPPFESRIDVITGKAYVTDGDGIRVARREVRIVGIDAPEWDQRARHSNGQWINHGRIVKSALIQEIGGKEVRVLVEGSDKFGRLIGTVVCEGQDVGEWLVREGHAIAAYDARYKRVQQEARIAKRGMWAHLHNFDPRAHRHRKQ